MKMIITLLIMKKRLNYIIYYLLMQLGFISYLEDGNFFKPQKKRIEFIPDFYIRFSSLKNLSMQENLSNSDSG